MSVFFILIFQLAVRCMSSDEVSNLYINQAEQLEAQGRFKDAEKYVNERVHTTYTHLNNNQINLVFSYF